MAYLDTIDKRKTLVTGQDNSLAIGEMAKKGKASGINFVSITPREIREEGPFYKVMPIEVETESTYEQLGLFLGLLDELDKSLVTLEACTVTPHTKDGWVLKSSLVLNMYIAKE